MKSSTLQVRQVSNNEQFQPSNHLSRKVPRKTAQNVRNEPVKLKKPKLDIMSTSESSELESSLVNMSLDDLPKVYHLPKASELKTNDQIKNFHKNIIGLIRRNRSNIDISCVENELRILNTDEQVGMRYFMNCYTYMESFECSVDPIGAYCLDGTGLLKSVRQKLVASLFRICRRLNTEVYSVHQATIYLDRFMKHTTRVLTREEYLRAGVMCWYIGVKFDMVFYPNLEDACRLAGISDIDSVKNFEFEILQAIGFNINLHSPIVCLRPFSMIQQVGESHSIAKLLLDLSYLEYEFSGHPSFVVATVVYIVSLAIAENSIDFDKIYPITAKYVSGLTIENILPVIKSLCKIVTNFYKSPSSSIYFEVRHRHSATVSLITVDFIKKLVEFMSN